LEVEGVAALWPAAFAAIAPAPWSRWGAALPMSALLPEGVNRAGRVGAFVLVVPEDPPQPAITPHVTTSAAVGPTIEIRIKPLRSVRA
jgi:hypothetical protein